MPTAVPSISVIIPVLNGSQTLGACLSSLSDQTCQDFEILLVDGGSSDHSAELLRAYPGLKARVLSQPGSGIFAAMNAGIDHARGEWLYFMGCDDRLFATDTLDRARALLRQTTCRWLAGKVYLPASDVVSSPLLGSPYLLRRMIHHQGLFYHRSLFANRRYRTDLRIVADYDLNLRLTLAGEPCEVSELIVADFGENGISTREPATSLRERLTVHRDVFGWLAVVWLNPYCRFNYAQWRLRHRMGLGNLRARARRQARKAAELAKSIPLTWF